MKPYRKPLKSFPEWTSTHGIPYVARSTKKFWIWFWVIAIIIFMGLLIWQTVMLCIKYFSFPVSVQYELKFEQRVFPAITVCDQNPYKKSVAYTFPKIQRLMTTYEYTIQKTACDQDDQCSIQTNATLDNYSEMYGLVNINDSTAINSMGRNLLGLESAGYNLSDAADTVANFILGCSFDMQDCDMDNDWTSYMDSRMGRCFMFNMNEKYLVHRAGPGYGLRIIMKTNISEYLPISDTAGMRVVVHDQDENPYPDVFGYNVQIGTSTSIGVQYTEMNRLSSPYGTCSNKKPSNYLYPLNYDSEGCGRSMLQNDYVTDCGCYDPTYPTPNYTTVGVCVIPNNLQCWQATTNNTKSYEKCKQPCDEADYDATVSVATWPRGNFLSVGNSKNRTVYTGNQITQMAQLEVYYNQLNYERMYENADYTFTAFMSDYGAQIGLWLGMSLVSFVEYIVLIVLLCAAFCCPTSYDRYHF